MFYYNSFNDSLERVEEKEGMRKEKSNKQSQQCLIPFIFEVQRKYKLFDLCFLGQIKIQTYSDKKTGEWEP